jgi:hypothetical protein
MSNTEERSGAASLEHEVAARPACVVLDTNAWYHDPLLKGAVGAALLYYLQRSGVRLGLPEVIERELAKHAIRIGEEAVQQIHAATDIIAKFTGSKPVLDLPSRDLLTDALQRRLAELQPLIQRVPFTLEDARAALDRVNSELPPNGPKNQQFKDSAIWESILRLSESYAVYFVTTDNGFFDRRPNKNGALAPTLRNECAAKSLDIQIYSSLASYLETLKIGAPPLDLAHLALAIDASIQPEVQHASERRGFALVALMKFDVSPFLTEQLGKLALSFSLTYSLAEERSEGDPRQDATVLAVGTCAYDMNTGVVSEAQFDRREYSWADDDGLHKSTDQFLHPLSGRFRSTAVVPYTLRQSV